MRQFLDVGAGLPAANNTPEVVEAGGFFEGLELVVVLMAEPRPFVVRDI